MAIKLQRCEDNLFEVVKATGDKYNRTHSQFNSKEKSKKGKGILMTN